MLNDERKTLIMHIKAVHLKNDNLPAVHDFYAHTLELPINSMSDTRLSIQVGTSELVFTHGNPAQYHLAFNIPQNAFLAGKTWISNRTGLIPTVNDKDEMNFTAWDAHSAYFYDSAGNVLEIIARHRLKNDSQAAFSGRSLLNISEIGFGVTDVEATTDLICDKFNLPVFDGDGSDVFTAIGNNNGLLIVVPLGREWFPNSRVDAEDLPLKIVFEHGSAHTLELPDVPVMLVSE